MKVWGGWIVGVLAVALLAGAAYGEGGNPAPGNCRAVAADGAVFIDGKANEAFWERAEWTAMDQCLLGPCEDKNDFSGRFKAAWKGSELFILAEIADDRLTDATAENLGDYWQGDYLGVYLADAPDRHDCKAFAYHILPLGDVIDVDTDGEPGLFPGMVRSAVYRNGGTYVWEVAITVYSDAYDRAAVSNDAARVLLTGGRKMGFGAAYCDNDGSGRESFYSNVPNQGDTEHLTADQIGTLELVR